MTLIGAPVRRVEDERLLTGRGRFVGDMVVPGMLHAAFLRSVHVHARLLSIDVTRNRAAAGIAACVTGEDLAPHARAVRAESRMKGYVATDFPALARGKVRFTGEAVAAVLGGFKGVGEGGTIGAPAAVANAIADALAPLGIDITELPMTPDRLFRLIHQREKRETP